MMAEKNKIIGLDDVLRNLTKESEKIKGRTERGVVKAALFVMGESKKLVPMRLGNLINSGTVIHSRGVSGGGSFKGEQSGRLSESHNKKVAGEKGAMKNLTMSGKPTAAVTYTAPYAMAVHENPRAGAAGNTSDQDIKRKSGGGVPLEKIHSKKGQWKFLQEPLLKNAQVILEIIKEGSKIG